MPAIGLTDTNNLFAAQEFSDKMAGAGIQPIIGMTLGVDFADQEEQSRQPLRKMRRPGLALLARDEQGYRNLMTLISRAYMDSEDVSDPAVSLAQLKDLSAGLIALTGGPDGPINFDLVGGREDRAKARFSSWWTVLATVFMSNYSAMAARKRRGPRIFSLRRPMSVACLLWRPMNLSSPPVRIMRAMMC